MGGRWLSHHTVFRKFTRLYWFFSWQKKIPKFAEELQDFMVDNILGLEFTDPELSFEKLYGKLVKWLKGMVESAVFTAQLEKRVKYKLRSLKRKELKRNFKANAQVLSRFNTSAQNFKATGSASFTGVKRKI